MQESNAGYVAPILKEIPSKMNFFQEALCVTSAIQFVADKFNDVRFVIYSDNQNTVDMFSSLAVKLDYNPLLKLAANHLLHHNLQLKVLYIPGEENQIADTLSYGFNKCAQNLSEGLTITPFEPPLKALKAFSK